MKIQKEKSMLLAAGFICLMFGQTVMAPASASTIDIYMEIAGIDGESTDSVHDGWIDVDTIGWGVSAGPTDSTRRRGEPVFEDVVWTQVMDKSFPKVFDDLVTGRFRPDITIDFTTQIADNSEVFFTMDFKNTFMTDLQMSGSSGGPAIMVSGAFAFEEIKVTYTEFDNRGGVLGRTEAQWSLKDGGSAAAVSSLFGLGLSGATVVPVPAAVWLFYAKIRIGNLKNL